MHCDVPEQAGRGGIDSRRLATPEIGGRHGGVWPLFGTIPLARIIPIMRVVNMIVVALSKLV
jgi:hypothetical protein